MITFEISSKSLEEEILEEVLFDPGFEKLILHWENMHLMMIEVRSKIFGVELSFVEDELLNETFLFKLEEAVNKNKLDRMSCQFGFESTTINFK